MADTVSPEACRCRGQDLAKLVAAWRRRTLPRILAALRSGGVHMRSLRAEANLLRDLAQKNDRAFEGRNPERGHICPECPYRRRHPNLRSVAVDRGKPPG